MKIIECEQLSAQWWEARRGVPTASDFDKILTPAKLKLSSQADSYIDQLIADRFDPEYPRVTEFLTPAMRSGVNTEAEARRWYELERGLDVRQVGFCTTDDGRVGCSPDGLVGEDGGLELKCPLPKTHVGYLRQGALPSDYLLQVHGCLVVTGRTWWDFVSYCPGFPPFMIRTTPGTVTAALQGALSLFLEMYDDALAKLRALQGEPQ